MLNLFKKKDKNMLDSLKGLWKSKESLHRLRDVLSCLVTILEHFEEDNLKDGSTRNAALDALIQLLQSEKT